MRKTLTVLALLTISLPAFGQECAFVNDRGDRAFDDFAQINVQRQTGETLTCPSTAVGTGMPQRLATCDDGYEGIYFFAPSGLDGVENDLLIFQNEIWYLDCR